jgi:YD repeat-containing protein
VGGLAWAYEYDPTGLVTLVARPTGSTRYQWDALGRPTRMVETGVDERYRWQGAGADLKRVIRNGEPVP